jgi:hypothetical protein
LVEPRVLLRRPAARWAGGAGVAGAGCPRAAHCSPLAAREPRRSTHQAEARQAARVPVDEPALCHDDRSSRTVGGGHDSRPARQCGERPRRKAAAGGGRRREGGRGGEACAARRRVRGQPPARQNTGQPTAHAQARGRRRGGCVNCAPRGVGTPDERALRRPAAPPPRRTRLGAVRGHATLARPPPRVAPQGAPTRRPG